MSIVWNCETGIPNSHSNGLYQTKADNWTSRRSRPAGDLPLENAIGKVVFHKYHIQAKMYRRLAPRADSALHQRWARVWRCAGRFWISLLTRHPANSFGWIFQIKGHSATKRFGYMLPNKAAFMDAVRKSMMRKTFFSATT